MLITKNFLQLHNTLPSFVTRWAFKIFSHCKGKAELQKRLMTTIQATSELSVTPHRLCISIPVISYKRIFIPQAIIFYNFLMAAPHPH